MLNNKKYVFGGLLSLFLIALAIIGYRLLNPQIIVVLKNKSQIAISDVNLKAGGKNFHFDKILPNQSVKVKILPQQDSSIIVSASGVKSLDANEYLPSGKQQYVILTYENSVFSKTYSKDRLVY